MYLVTVTPIQKMRVLPQFKVVVDVRFSFYDGINTHWREKKFNF